MYDDDVDDLMIIMLMHNYYKKSCQPPQISVCPTKNITVGYIIIDMFQMDKPIYSPRKCPAAPTAPQPGHF
jgi:hypothetical protein